MEAKRLSKPQQLSSEDIITTLPQCIIDTILCLLPIEEAARTSILSKEWRFKWTTIPKLVFHESTFERPTEENHPNLCTFSRINKDIASKLFCAVHQILLQHQGPIHEFTLWISADQTFSEIDQIILHLSRNHNLKKLSFNFYNSDLDSDPDSNWYGLPLSILPWRHLTDLYLDTCAINHKHIFSGFGSLTSLSLTNVRFSAESFLHLLSNCPSLKKLCLFLDVDNFKRNERPSIMELFKNIPMIEHLTISGFSIESLIQAELPTSLIHLKYCTIEGVCFVDGYGLPFLLVLIKCSPNLEKIKLQIDNACYTDIKPVNMEEYSDVWLEHLNELKIESFSNLKPEMEFVKFILARSPNLKKVILLTYCIDKNEELEMSKVLRHAPRARASPVEITVEKC